MTQTCSLPCYKKHQQRASCSGKRDPASYIKKNQLATPTGLDQDYNYLRSIERSLDDANADVQDRGLAAGHHNLRNASAGWQTESRLHKYLAENQITLERAPWGMKRQRVNTTRTTRNHDALWTVEWVTHGSDCKLQHDAEGRNSIARLFASFARAKDKSKVDPVDVQPKKKKRKHAGSASRGPGAGSATSTPATEGGSKLDVDQSVTQQYSAVGPGIQDSGAESHKSHQPAPAQAEVETKEISRELPDEPSKAPSMTAAAQIANLDGDHDQHHYYLLKPATASASKVLIPLTPTATLTESLQHRVIQEFPTIYVLDVAPGSLPAGYMLEDDFVKARQAEDIELLALQKSAAGAQPATNLNEASDAGVLDARSILDMLKRDITR